MSDFNDVACCAIDSEALFEQARSEIKNDMDVVIKNKLKDLLIQIEEAKRNVIRRKEDFDQAKFDVIADPFGFAMKACEKRRIKNG